MIDHPTADALHRFRHRRRPALHLSALHGAADLRQLEKLDFRLVEAGFDLYATRGQVLRRIIIPLAKPGIIAGLLLVFIPSLGAYITPLILGGGRI